MADWRDILKSLFPREATYLYRLLRDRSDGKAVLAFLNNPELTIPLKDRIGMMHKLCAVSHHVEIAHMEEEMIAVMSSILRMPGHLPGVVVEAGCFKGASTAKFSLAAKYSGRQLIVFDSFCGIPPNDEDHGKNIFGDSVNFPAGDYSGNLEEVKHNIDRYGQLDICTFHKGWFEDTMPSFSEPITTAYIDVDLASSTRTCLRYLYPRLVEGGELYSQDGHLPLVIDVFRDKTFWREEVGCEPPFVDGLGEKKLIKIKKVS